MTAKLSRMATRKNENPGKRSRSPMQIPLSWWTVINQLSHVKKQPALWVVIDLLAKEASANGIEVPKAPWEPGYREGEE